MLDFDTLHAVMVITQALMGGFLLLVWQNQRSERALLVWGVTNLVCAGPTYFFVLQDSLHPFLTIIVASWGVTGFVFGYWAGLRCYLGMQVNLRIILSAFLLQTAVILYFTFVESLLWPRFSINTLTVSVICGFVVREAYRGRKQNGFLAYTLFMVTFAVHGLIFLFSGVQALIDRPVGGYEALNDGASSIAIIEGLLMFFATSICVAILVPEKLSAKLKVLNHKFYQSSITDSLTNLYNRGYFISELERVLKQSAQTGEPTTILYIDLDGFKEINDHYGHVFGDELLIRMGHALQTRLADEGLVARMGGDEFAILLKTSPAELPPEALAQSLLDAITTPLEIDEILVSLSASIGIATSHSGRETEVELIRNADIAMYYAKQEGQGSVRAFTEAMRETLAENNWLKEELKAAIERRDISVAFQPRYAVLGLSEPKIVGLEALARWTHPEQGPIDPTLFIPIAEKTGLIDQLQSLILEQTFSAMAGWPELLVSVNVSDRLLQDEDRLKTMILSANETAGLPLERIELEIGETLFLSEDIKVRERLEHLRSMGLKLVLDGFGSGYASFRHLQEGRLDGVKLDHEFIRSMRSSDQMLEITQVVLNLALALDVMLVAQGVESEEQFRFLKRMGCNYIQGNYCSEPIPLDDLNAFLEKSLEHSREASYAI